MTHHGPERRVRQTPPTGYMRDVSPGVWMWWTDQRRPVRDEAPLPTEAELAEAMHEERMLREGCRSGYASEVWTESKAVRERWIATARVALRMVGGKG